MKKVSLLILMSLFILLVFASCNLLPGNNGGDDQGEPECEHQWTEATCTAPQLCSLCGERKGTLLSHDLVAATCTEAKTCTMCHQTWGEPLGHKWSAGSCTVARTCKTCQEVEGEAPGHDYADATCDKPMTCRLCSATEGEALGHKYIPVVTKPTCTANGYTTNTCATCKDSYVDNIVEALGHLNDIDLPAKDATCTEDGATAGVRCSQCNTDTTPQIIIEALGHKPTTKVISPTCTESGHTEYTCSVCNYSYTGNNVPALGHDYGNAACGTIASCQREGCEDATASKPIEHDFAPATCTEPATCKRGCGTTEGEPLGHNMSVASCISASVCLNKCGLTEGDKDAHVLTFTYVKDTPTYTCELCNSTYKLDNFYYLNGESYDNLTPGNNSGTGYVVGDKSNNPVIAEDENGNKYFATLKADTTTAAGQAQFWIPKEDKAKTDFSANNGAAGVISFKINAFFDTNFSMKIVDGSASPDRWSDDWCINDNFFTLTPPTADADGNLIVTVGGWNGSTLKTITVTEEDKFTGWMDVIIGIELDANSDTITMHYYIDGQYMHSETRALTTLTNAVNCFYISGNSATGGSGIMLDDVVFGYTVAGAWCFDGHVHDWTASETVEPDCIHDGYTIYTCSQGCTRRDDFKNSLGHVNVDFDELLPTCTEDGYTAGQRCTVCDAITSGKKVVPATGHSYITELTVPTCTEGGYTTYTCTVCEFVTVGDEIAALGHDFAGARCDQIAVCEREGCDFDSGDEPIGHDFAPATCTTPATCKRIDCNETTGEPIPHDMLAATCVAPSTCSYGCGHTEGDLGTHVLTYKYVSATPTYVCSACKVSFALEDYYYMNGNNHDNMEGVSNFSSYSVASKSNNPLIVDGHYELLNTKGTRSQYQLWIPSSKPNSGLVDFSCEGNAVGFFSFKINAYLTEAEGFGLKIGDATHRNVNPFPWSEYFTEVFKISKASTVDGITTSVLTGHNGETLATISGADKFTGWIDVAIGIELSADTNQLTLHYYINGKIVTTYSKEMPITTGKINAAYITGYTSEKNSGIMLDDIVFGYAKEGAWMFDDCAHTYEETVFDPSCTQPGYSELYCPICGHKDIDNFVEAPGHKGGEPTCDTQAICEVCEQPYGDVLGHKGGKATCVDQAICVVCDKPYGELAAHTPTDPICLGDTVCSVCSAEMAQSTHSLTIVALSQLSCKCVQCNASFVMDQHYYFDGTDSSFKNLVTVDEQGVFNGDKSTAVINANGQYEFIHNDNNTNGKAVVWVPKNTGGDSFFTGFTTDNNAVGVVSFKINSYMTETLSLQFVDTTLRGVSGVDFWTQASISDGFFKIDPPTADNVVTVKGWDVELMQIQVTDENKWTGWLDVTIGIELSKKNDSVTVYYYINGEYLGSATRNMSIMSDKIDGLYFNGRCNVAGGGYMLDNLGFGYTTKSEWIFDK